MTTTFPRRFVIAEAPSATAWIAEALNRAFNCPREPATGLDGLIERLMKPR